MEPDSLRTLERGKERQKKEKWEEERNGRKVSKGDDLRKNMSSKTRRGTAQPNPTSKVPNPEACKPGKMSRVIIQESKIGAEKNLRASSKGPLSPLKKEKKGKKGKEKIWTYQGRVRSKGWRNCALGILKRGAVLPILSGGWGSLEMNSGRGAGLGYG